MDAPNRKAREAAYQREYWKNMSPEQRAKYECCRKLRRRTKAAAVNASNRTYYQANLERMRDGRRAAQARRRERTSGPGVTDHQWAEQREVFANRCAYCLAEASQRDHMQPICKGGPDSIENVVPVCARCNSSKHSSTLLQWLLGTPMAA